jgi:hypothetical protein
MSPAFAYDAHDQQVVDTARQILSSFRISRKLALVPSDVDHTIFK